MIQCSTFAEVFSLFSLCFSHRFPRCLFLSTVQRIINNRSEAARNIPFPGSSLGPSLEVLGLGRLAGACTDSRVNSGSLSPIPVCNSRSANHFTAVTIQGERKWFPLFVHLLLSSSTFLFFILSLSSSPLFSLLLLFLLLLIPPPSSSSSSPLPVFLYASLTKIKNFPHLP